jgi:hypothetical protein
MGRRTWVWCPRCWSLWRLTNAAVGDVFLCRTCGMLLRVVRFLATEQRQCIGCKKQPERRGTDALVLSD